MPRVPSHMLAIAVLACLTTACRSDRKKAEVHADEEKETLKPKKVIRRGGAMVKIPGGTFQMGDNVDDPQIIRNVPEPYLHQQPIHSVTVASFEMDETEVTVDAYKACVDDKGCSSTDLTGANCNWGEAWPRQTPDELHGLGAVGGILQVGRQTIADRRRMGIRSAKRSRRQNVSMGKRSTRYTIVLAQNKRRSHVCSGGLCKHG